MKLSVASRSLARLCMLLASAAASNVPTRPRTPVIMHVEWLTLDGVHDPSIIKKPTLVSSCVRHGYREIFPRPIFRFRCSKTCTPGSVSALFPFQRQYRWIKKTPARPCDLCTDESLLRTEIPTRYYAFSVFGQNTLRHRLVTTRP